MSIEKYVDDNYFTTFTPVCDGCGDMLGDKTDFYDAVNAKKDAGWKSHQEHGEWVDLCPDCQNHHSQSMKDAAKAVVGKRKKKQ